MNVLVDKRNPESYYFAIEIDIPEEKYEEYVSKAANLQSKSMQKEFWTVNTSEKECDYMNRFHEFFKSCKHTNHSWINTKTYKL